MIVDDFRYDREPQPGSVEFSRAHERIEERFTNCGRDAGTIVGNSNIKRIIRRTYVYCDCTNSIWSSLACVEHQIEKCPLHFLSVKYAIRWTRSSDLDFAASELGPRENSFHRMADDLVQQC